LQHVIVQAAGIFRIILLMDASLKVGPIMPKLVTPLCFLTSLNEIIRMNFNALVSLRTK